VKTAKVLQFAKKLIKPCVGLNNEDFRKDWIKKELQSVPENSRILDAGAGTQQYRQYCQHLNYVSQDFGEYDGQGDNSALQMGEFDYGNLDIISDISAIPEADSSFDAVMCTEVFEHLPNPIQAIQEFSRLLKPGGHLIVTAPFCSLTHFAPYHFSTGFSRYWYEIHLGKHDFINIELIPNGNFFEYLAQEIYRMPYISERYSKDKPNILELLSIVFVQKMLLRFSQKDIGSSELLCFGYCLHAQKANIN
jgi:SAM-dependent methyltransferase